MLTITEAASHQIREMMEAEGQENLKLRLAIRGGGCSGLSYGMGFDADTEEDDTVVEVQGIPVVVDKESAPVLKGVVIDYKQNMMGGGFTIDNPNAIASCGCGSSFRTATNEGTPEEC